MRPVGARGADPPPDPSFRALSGRLKFTVRRHKTIKILSLMGGGGGQDGDLRRALPRPGGSGGHPVRVRHPPSRRSADHPSGRRARASEARERRRYPAPPWRHPASLHGRGCRLAAVVRGCRHRDSSGFYRHGSSRRRAVPDRESSLLATYWSESTLSSR